MEDSIPNKKTILCKNIGEHVHFGPIQRGGGAKCNQETENPDIFLFTFSLQHKKWPLYCPQGSGTLRQQLLIMHGMAWYRIVLHSIAWYCMVLHCIAWYCMALSFLALSCTILHYLALSCTILHYLALSCTILQYLALTCTILHYLALSFTILHYLALS